MQNKIRSTIGGLALLASTALGQAGAANAPFITNFKRTPYANRDKIEISATNFNSGVAFNLYKSTNLVDWTKVNAVVYSDMNPTASVYRSYSEIDNAFRKCCNYLLSTTNVSSFVKTKKKDL
jgi:hypothetical protein